MTILGKILTLLRGSVRELGESVIDANGTRIYEQEIVEAKAAVAKAKEELTSVMAKQMQSAREIDRLKGEIDRFEKLAIASLEKQEERLAEEAERSKLSEEETRLLPRGLVC